MKLRHIMLFCCIALLGIPVVAADSTHHADSMEHKMGGMPEMGPPKQMKDISFLEGEWSVKGRMKMEPEADWMETSAKCTYAYTCGGAVMSVDYRSNFMGMEFIGLGLQTYDRESKEWQMTWVDNMSGRQSMSTGFRKNGKSVLLGETKYMGKMMLNRYTTYDETKTSFKWMMEHSMDGGKNWYTSMEATYTKN